MYTLVLRTSGRAPRRAKSVRGHTSASPDQLPTSAVRIPCGVPSMRNRRTERPCMREILPESDEAKAHVASSAYPLALTIVSIRLHDRELTVEVGRSRRHVRRIGEDLG